MLLNEEMTIQQMISKNPLKNFLYFEGQLPYKVNINTDFYIFDISVDLNGNYDSKLKKRKILFTSSQHWVENQKMPSIKSVLSYNFVKKCYTNISSKFKMCVEVYDDEIDLLLAKDNLPSKVENLYQTILLFISSKYNLSLVGKDCINISIEDCGAGIIYLYIPEDQGYKMACGNIIPSYTVSQHFNHKMLNFKDMLVQNDIIWLYYYNMAIYSFDRREYLNTIIYSAISMESYLNYLIQTSMLENEFKEYNNMLIQQKKVPGFFTTIKFLKKKNIIDKTCFEAIKSCYGVLSELRNDIIHGNIQTLLLNKDISEKGLDKLTDIYETKESNFVSKNI